MLRFVAAVMGDDGVVAIDHGAHLHWSPAMLADELAHDADLDIESLFTVHVVTSDAATPAPYWAHTHGLRELGFFDVDVVGPSPRVSNDFLAEAFRALAFSIVEGRAKVDGDAIKLASPGGDVALFSVGAAERAFTDGASAPWRASVDDEHRTDRAVVCEPRATGLRALFGSKPTPARLFRRDVGAETLVHFSHEASALMARRAQGTLDVFRATRERFAELELPAIVKLGYVVDGGGPNDREHLWFGVHGLDGGTIDATLLNAPFGIARMKPGDRGWHDVALLSDWAIMTPVGRIHPRSMVAARRVDGARDQIRAEMQRRRQGASSA
jgi:hypothetical protein